jgi:Uncharacterized protein conserved in bacteria
MTWTSALGQIRSGKVIPIVVSSNARLAEFPDLPTFKDLGYDDLTAVSWFALSGPAGLPKDITQRLNATVARCWSGRTCASASIATPSRRAS